MKWLSLVALLVTVAAADDGQTVATVAESDILGPYRNAALERWSDDIAALEARDAAADDPSGAVLFAGSSSIRLWEDIRTDMTPFPVIRRGYGGAAFKDMAVFAKRLLHPHSYRALVLFNGNDVKGVPEDPSPDRVRPLVEHILSVSRQHRPDAPVLIIEVSPAPSRFPTGGTRVRDFNAMLREVSLATPHVYFVPTWGHLLSPDGQPREELFDDDRLHLNRDGYELWSKLIRRRLTEVLRLEALRFGDGGAAATRNRQDR